MKRLKVLMMFGGESSEHDVSLKSASNVYKAIDKQKYEVILGYIDHDGRWWLLNNWSDAPDDMRQTQLVIAPGTGKVLTVPGSQAVHIDILFPVLHGKFGEDGTIQGLAEMAHIPIVGCNVEASALCMDKNATKLVIQSVGIPVVPWCVVSSSNNVNDYSEYAKKLSKTGPWFVKPARAGSSVGVSKVTDLENLHDAVKLALSHDSSALIEAAVIGRELEVAVLGNTPSHRISGIGEIIPGSDFYDYDDKYSSTSSSSTVMNAILPNEISDVIKQHAADSYAALGCSGLARVDFLLSDDQVPFINEVNTMPGFTDISMYPKLWAEQGLEYEELVDTLIQLALE